MKISRTLAAAALSGALVLGGTTVAFAANEGVPLSDTLVYNGVTYYKNSNGDYVPAADSKDESGKDVDEVITAEDMETHVKSGEAKAPESAGKESESEETSEKTTEAKASESTSATKSSEATSSASTTKSSDASSSASTSKSSDASSSASTSKSSEASSSASTTKSSEPSETASATTTPSESKSAEPTPSKDKKSSARDALSSKEGKPTPLAIFGIVAGVLAAVAAAFPVIAKTLNLNIKLPF
ncbi:hypothetical protein ACWJIK_12130 [Corynebacterium minutissimum]